MRPATRLLRWSRRGRSGEGIQRHALLLCPTQRADLSLSPAHSSSLAHATSRYPSAAPYATQLDAQQPLGLCESENDAFIHPSASDPSKRSFLTGHLSDSQARHSHHHEAGRHRSRQEAPRLHSVRQSNAYLERRPRQSHPPLLLLDLPRSQRGRHHPTSAISARQRGFLTASITAPASLSSSTAAPRRSSRNATKQVSYAGHDVSARTRNTTKARSCPRRRQTEIRPRAIRSQAPPGSQHAKREALHRVAAQQSATTPFQSVGPARPPWAFRLRKSPRLP